MYSKYNIILFILFINFLDITRLHVVRILLGSLARFSSATDQTYVNDRAYVDSAV